MSLNRILMLGAVVFGIACVRSNAGPSTAPQPALAVIAVSPDTTARPRAVDSASHAQPTAENTRVVPSLAVADTARAVAPQRTADSLFAAATERARQIADSLAVAAMLAAADSSETESDENFPALSLDPYAGHDRVEYYMKLFTGSARARMGQRLSAGTRYSTMIRDKLRAAGIPEEFLYLALIESGYNPHAYSSAAAVGMWQFMTRTARGAGLRVDWWIDERRDPVRATDAAIRYLNELRDQFGSLYLAAAAYNGGAGRVSRGLRSLSQRLEGKELDDKFFVLASTSLLRAETRNYVPQLIAAALVGRDPLAYGITVDTLPAFVFDSVLVPPATPLTAVAKVCGAELGQILDLNGQILRGVNAPGGAHAWLRIPPDCAPTFADGFAALSDEERIGVVTRSSKKGETANSIAKTAGISVTALRSYNPTLSKTASSKVLSVGTKLLVPTQDALKGARTVADPAIERFGVASGGSYVVRRGDTLGGIAQRNNTTVSALRSLNGLRSDRIVAGQRLRVGH